MNTHESALDYKGFRFPPEIISYAVWLYFRFSLSFRNVEELLARRGIVVTYDTGQGWAVLVRETPCQQLRLAVDWEIPLS